MRLAILEPAGDPPPGRRSDRLGPEVAVRLARSGHEVTLLGARPHRVHEGVRIVQRRCVAHRLLRRFDYDEGLALAPAAVWALAHGGFDVAHAFSPADAWAALAARRLGGPPFVLSLPATPTRRWLVARRHRLAMLLAATEGAACLTVPSAAAAAAFRRYLLREPHVLRLPSPSADRGASSDWAATVHECERAYRAALGAR